MAEKKETKTTEKMKVTAPEEPVIAPKQPKKPMVREPETENKIYSHTYIGNASEDIWESTFHKSAEEVDYENFVKLNRFKNDEEILWATIYGVEIVEDNVVICAMWNGIQVFIPSYLYFEPEFNFGKRYNTLPPEEKLSRLYSLARYQQGAKICFVIEEIDHSEITEGDFKDQYITKVIGNRTKAMEIMRDIFFWHENRKQSGNDPREVKRGDIISAHVLCVKEDTVLVECIGVETRLGSHNLLQGDVVTNCGDYVKPGDQINVRVKEVILNDDKTVHLSVTGRMSVPTKLVDTIRIGSTYLGKVAGYNHEKKTYHVLLANDVSASVPKDKVKGHIELYRGDRVVVFVTNVYKSFVTGTMRKV